MAPDKMPELLRKAEKDLEDRINHAINQELDVHKRLIRALTEWLDDHQHGLNGDDLVELVRRHYRAWGE